MQVSCRVVCDSHQCYILLYDNALQMLRIYKIKNWIISRPKSSALGKAWELSISPTVRIGISYIGLPKSGTASRWSHWGDQPFATSAPTKHLRRSRRPPSVLRGFQPPVGPNPLHQFPSHTAILGACAAPVCTAPDLCPERCPGWSVRTAFGGFKPNICLLFFG